MRREPIRHHYIPRFILRNFCNEKDILTYCDKETKETTVVDIKEIFMEKNMYRDEINSVSNPTKIEEDLSRFEGEVSKIIKQMLIVDKVVLAKEDDEKIKLFLAIMGFRNHRTKYNFAEEMSSVSKDMYLQYQVNGDFLDLWKRNLGYLVNCRTRMDVINHTEIDQPIKVFMMRDIYGVFGTYLAIVEKREKEGFVVGDTYPAVVTGTHANGWPLHMYSINPISPSRAILLASNGAEWVPGEVLGFRSSILSKPKIYLEDDSVAIRVKKIYPEEVRVLNNMTIHAAQKGYVIKTDS